MKYQACVLLLATVLLSTGGSIVLAQEPCSAEPIQVLNVDPCGMKELIGVEDSVTICQIRCLMDKPEDPGKECGINPGWIGGTVVFDEQDENGFHFVPSTVRIAEEVAEALQTSVCFISENPKDFDGGLWYIHIDLAEIQ